MIENLKLELVQGRMYEVATFTGETNNWDGINSGIANSYDTVFNGNTMIRDGMHYYTFYAATAGEGIQGIDVSITRSICPKGWRIPNGGSTITDHSFTKLNSTYRITNNPSGSSKLRQLPLSFSYDGAYQNGNYNPYGRWWTITPIPNSEDNLYIQFLDPNYATAASDPYSKANGFTIKCTAI